jgi:hypothetical protein
MGTGLLMDPTRLQPTPSTETYTPPAKGRRITVPPLHALFAARLRLSERLKRDQYSLWSMLRMQVTNCLSHVQEFRSKILRKVHHAE